MTKRYLALSITGLVAALSLAICFAVGMRAGRGSPLRPIAPRSSQVVEAKKQHPLLDSFPVIFESNVGQSDPRVRFLSHGRDSTLFVSEDGAVLALTPPRTASSSARLAKPTKRRVRTTESGVLAMRFLGANPSNRVEGSGKLSARINYFIGNDPKRWHRNVPAWREVIARNVWPRANVRYHGDSGRLEFDIELEPGANPSAIRIGLKGASSIHPGIDGNLMIQVGARMVKLGELRIYQERDGQKVSVGGHFEILSRNVSQSWRAQRAGDEVAFGFALAPYDRQLPLTIDPTLTYSSFLGGSGAPARGVGDSIDAIVVDSADNTYVAGAAASPNFPTTSGAFQSVCPAAVFCDTGFVAKLDPSGSSLLFATFLGGSGNGSGTEEPIIGLAIDDAGDAYVSGNTASTDFPTTQGALEPTGTGGGFVSKLSPDGSSLTFSTYLNGKFGSLMGGIAVDSAGDAYVTGQASPPFPVTPNGSFNPGLNAGAFATELNPSGSQVLFSALFGSGVGQAIAVGSNGYIYVAGNDPTGQITTTSTAFQTKCVGCNNPGTESTEGFLAVLNPAASTPRGALVYSTYLGGSQPGSFYNGTNTGDAMMGMAVDGLGRAYLDGVTGRTDFPTTAGAYQNSCLKQSAGNCDNAFLAVVDPSRSGVASLVYSSYFGGHGGTYGNALAIDDSGRAYIAGQTFARDLPVTSNAIEKDCLYCGQPPDTQMYNSAAFFTVLNPFASSQPGQLVYSTYLGGTGTTGNLSNEDGANAIAVDASGRTYVAGRTFSTDFPVTAGAAQPVCLACFSHNCDAFVSKIDPLAGSLIYSTFVGGSGSRTGGDGATGVALDSSGKIYVTGFSGSTDFPTTTGSFLRKCRACVEYDSTVAFVAKLNPAAAGQNQLIYSTYLGGTSQFGDAGADIAVDSAGEAYVAGVAESADFPTTSNAYQPLCHACAIGGAAAFMTKLDSSGSNLVYSSFLGGATTAEALGVAVDPAGAAFLAGETFDSDFPITSGAAQPNCPACANFDPEGFLTKIDPSLSGPASLVYSTFIGGSGIPRTVPPQGDVAYRVALNSLGQAVVAGSTRSADYPVTSNAYMRSCPSGLSRGECAAVFIAVIDPAMTGLSSLRYSTFFGGSMADYGYAVAVDSLNRIYFVEHTFSLDLPTSPNAYSPLCPQVYEEFECESAFVGALDPSVPPFAQLFYGTYLGGTGLAPLDYPTAIAVDAGGNIYVAGYTYATALPTTSDAVQSSCLACSRPGTERGDPFLTELNPAASASAQLVYSTYFGGSAQLYDDQIFDYPTDIALDSAGDVVLAGSTFSHDFPLTSNALQSKCPGCQNIGGRNAFVAEFSFPTPIGTLTPPPPVTPSPTPLRTPSPTMTPGPTATATITPTPTATVTPVESALTVTPKSINFGRVPFASTRGPRSVTLSNEKTSQTVTIEKVTVTSSFAIPPGSCLGELAPGKSCKIPVRFTAADIATFEGSLTFTTNDRNPVSSVHLRGIGVKRK